MIPFLSVTLNKLQLNQPNMKKFILSLCAFFFINALIFAQSTERPSFQSGKLQGAINLDGILDEDDWKNAPILQDFLTTEPLEKGTPSFQTTVRVIANEKFVICILLAK